jgi:hypothetical protein
VVVFSVLLLSRVQPLVSLLSLFKGVKGHPSVEGVIRVFDVSDVGLLVFFRDQLRVW